MRSENVWGSFIKLIFIEFLKMGVKVFKHKVKSLVETEHEYTFPEFIFKLRKSLGASRKVACEDTGISESRLVNLENGNFTQFPEHELPLLCEYYSIPRSLLCRKAKLFVYEKFVDKSKVRRIRMKEKFFPTRDAI